MGIPKVDNRVIRKLIMHKKLLQLFSRKLNQLMLQSSTVTKKQKNHGHTIVLAKLIWIAVLRE